MVELKKFKIKINSAERIESLLQELYNESCKNVEQIQTEMNKLSNSIKLNDESLDSKTKYAKAMNDFIANKDKAIGRKMEIAKLMTEIFKYNGNLNKTFSESEAVGDWSALIDKVKETEPNTSDKRREYSIK